MLMTLWLEFNHILDLGHFGYDPCLDYEQNEVVS
jgi:hypothetical protein